jgi:hypothetical protein
METAVPAAAATAMVATRTTAGLTSVVLGLAWPPVQDRRASRPERVWPDHRNKNPEGPLLRRITETDGIAGL